MNKADLLSNINAKVSESALGRLILDSDLREVLGTDTDSVVESLYPTTVNDTNLSGTITSPGVGFSYDVSFSKVGKLVNLEGTVIQTTIGGSDVFDIIDADYQPEKTTFAVGEIATSSDFIRVSVLDNTIGDYRLNIDDLLLGEVVYINITYVAKQ